MRRPPPHAYFAVSAVFHYLGPAFAVLLFARVDVLGVAWLRIATAALVFAAWRRPWRMVGALDHDGRRLLAAWGGCLALMNCCFYLAIDRLPLATVAAIEFLPVIGLAALGARTSRNLAALALAVAGVYLLTGIHLAGGAAGLALAFANAALFALYIVLADRVAKRPALDGVDGLGAAMLVAAVVVTPLAGWAALPAITDPVALAAGAGVGLSSSVIPYVCDQLALTRLARATYSLMVSLLPAIATVIGIVVLTQIPSATEVAGRGGRRRGRRAAPPAASGSAAEREDHRQLRARRLAGRELDRIGHRGDRRQPEAQARAVGARERPEAVVLDDDPQRAVVGQARVDPDLTGIAVAVGVQDRIGDRFGDGEPDVTEAAVDNPYALGVRGDLAAEDGDLLGSRRNLPPCWLCRHAAGVPTCPASMRRVCARDEAFGLLRLEGHERDGRERVEPAGLQAERRERVQTVADDQRAGDRRDRVGAAVDGPAELADAAGGDAQADGADEARPAPVGS